MNLWLCCAMDLDIVRFLNISQQISLDAIFNNKVSVYSCIDYVQRRVLWMDFTHIATQNIPWVSIRDLNVVVGDHEKKGGPSHLNISSDEFVAFTDVCDLIHMNTVAVEFTQTNGRKGRGCTNIRLDGVICNTTWYTIWFDTSC